MIKFINKISTIVFSARKPERGAINPLPESIERDLIRKLQVFGAERVDHVIETQLAELKRQLEQVSVESEIDSAISSFIGHWTDVVSVDLVIEALERLAPDIASARRTVEVSDRELLDQALLALIELEIDKRSNMIRESVRIMRTLRMRELTAR